MCFVQRTGGILKEKDKNDQEPVKPFNEDKWKRIGTIPLLPKVKQVWQFLLTVCGGGQLKHSAQRFKVPSYSSADGGAVLRMGVSLRTIGPC